MLCKTVRSLLCQDTLSRLPAAPIFATGRSLFASDDEERQGGVATQAAAIRAIGIQGREGTVNPWLIAITVTLATFMELLDTAIANVSLPHIAGGLATSYDESTW